MGLVIGIPKEHDPFEYRVGLTPAGVAILTAKGHQCYVESGAGVGSGFPDLEFEQAGARITYTREEVFRRADLLLKLHRPTEQEAEWMNDGQTVMAMTMLASAHESHVRAFTEKKATILAYELVQHDDGFLPVLAPLSQIGGRMTAQIAAQYLQNNKGGKGILLGGIPGVPPADVVIIGAGIVGLNAADAFLRNNARVLLMDRDLRTLQAAHDRFEGQVTTMVSHDFNVARVSRFADVLVGAVHVPGERAPILLTRDMVRAMRPGSLIIDMSIDQGGCVESSRPMSHDNPVFVAEGVTHYCVTNVPGVVGRTATHAFLNAAWPYIQQVIADGVDAAVEASPPLRRSLVMREGELRRDIGR